MNTDKLLELQRWTMKKGSDGAQWSVYMDHDEQGEWVKWAHVRQAVLFSEISGAAALRAEQAVGDEQRARELLAECLEGLNATSHGPALEGSLRDRIARALGTARQSEGVVVDDSAVRTDKLARAMYSDHSGNHPTIHCNRFPTWDELTNEQRTEWRKKALAAAPGGEGEVSRG